MEGGPQPWTTPSALDESAGPSLFLFLFLSQDWEGRWWGQAWEGDWHFSIIS